MWRLAMLMCMLLCLQPCSSYLPYLRFIPKKLTTHRRMQQTSSVEMLDKQATLQVNSPASMQTRPPMLSIQSSNIDFQDAVKEVIANAASYLHASQDTNDIDAVVFQVSSVYETTVINYEIIGQELLKQFPLIKHVIGSTSGCPIAPLTPYDVPVEQESKHGISMQFYSYAKHNVKIESFQMSPSAVLQYIHDDNMKVFPTSSNPGLAMLFATESVKANISSLCTKLQAREGISTFGSFPSTVNMLQAPKTFFLDPTSRQLQESTENLVGLRFEGDIDFDTYIASSIKPAGPLYEISKFEGNTILAIKNDEGVELSPMEYLDQVIKALPAEEALNLKKELIISIQSSKDDSTLMGQKPTAFNPLAGSVAIPELKADKSKVKYLQFCVKDSMAVRKGLEKASSLLRAHLKQYNAQAPPLALLSFGNIERGSNVFRIFSWESTQMYNALKFSGLQDRVGFSGSFGTGSIICDRMDQGHTTVTETEGIYIVLKSKSSSPHLSSAIHEQREVNKNWLVSPDDVLSPEEKMLHNDELDTMLVGKRDPDSAHAVKVADMDFSIPEKMARATNYLESLVWDREKDADRLRERYATARAITMAKAADRTLPRRDFMARLEGLQSKPGLIVDFGKTSLYNGNYGCDVIDPTVSDKLLERFTIDTTETFSNNLLALSCNVDISAYKGVFEDLELVKKKTNVPILCNDFTVFAYQLFRAKAHGSDAVRIYAASLAPQDISYLIKTAKALGMVAIVVVASKQQLLDTLRDVQGVEVLSVTSRNLRLWKIDEGKAARILRDPEVQEAIATTKASSKFYIMQEGFATADDVQQAKSNGIDIIFLGEELLHLQSTKPNQDPAEFIISDSVNRFLSP